MLVIVIRLLYWSVSTNVALNHAADFVDQSDLGMRLDSNQENPLT